MEKCLAADTAKLEMSKLNVQLENCVNWVLSILPVLLLVLHSASEFAPPFASYKFPCLLKLTLRNSYFFTQRADNSRPINYRFSLNNVCKG